ncbi:MAG: HAD family phosphatase [Chlamydiales bacterium]|nr:HAD family phosphatase [Chlamydiales bacterium]
MDLQEYQLVLFDFDGVLVDTEALHFEAYKQMCAKRGISLKWDEHEYAQFALYSAYGLRKALVAEYPQLREVKWETLYQEKKEAYHELISKHVELMPGVQPLLEELAGRQMCVVTHSPRAQIERIREMHPILQTIPRWITREDYEEPKPSSECYLKAIELHEPVEKIVGFEDSPRGLTALLGTRAKGILVTSVLPQEEIARLRKEMPPFEHIQSFDSVLA